MNGIKRIVISITVALSMFCLFVQKVNAEYTSPQFDMEEGWKQEIEYTETMVGVSGENVAQTSTKSLYSFVDIFVSKLAKEVTVAGADIDANKDLAQEAKLSVSGVVENGIVSMFENTPKVDLVAHLASEWVPGYESTNSVYADGYDDLVSSGVDKLWSTTRNIAYLCYVVVMLVIGFMIMFRHKLGGQALVTIGNSIPKLIISLVVVTFSFAIMGLIIDFGGLLMNVISSMLNLGENGIAVDNAFELFGNFFSQNKTLDIVSKGLGIASIGGIIAACITGGLPAIIGGTIIVGLLLLIIVGIVLVGAIKLWITLLKSYLSLLINVVVSPLAVMFGAIPGNSGMANIFKSALKNVLVFPVAYGIVNLPYYAELKGVNFLFPETIVGEVSSSSDIIAPLMLSAAKVVAIYAAASAPAILAAVIPSNSSKAAADAAGVIKANLAGVPLIGGMFK